MQVSHAIVMDELRQIFKLYHEVLNEGSSAVLASVVKTSGSTYRRSGARMLIAKDGKSAGLISGGCVEADLRERSAPLFAGGLPSMVTYDSTSGDDILWGLGLGCTGVAEILLEQVSREHQSKAIEFLEACRQRRCPGVMATVLRVERQLQPERYVRACLSDGSWSCDGMFDDATTSVLREACEAVLETGVPVHKTISSSLGSLDVFVEYLSPPPSLVIFGAGPDAVPIARLASELGWTVSVVDAREAYLTRAAFPEAEALVAAPAEEMVERVTMTENGLALVMTHNFNRDCTILQKLFHTEARYIGLLGPRAKADLLLDQIRREGMEISERALERFHAPVGLDIGAETPEEIAHSVISEMLAVLHGRHGEFLRNRAGRIHT